jgi:type VI secretion system secreted protein VgrG
VGQNQHIKLGNGQYIETGNEIHLYAGSKVVIEAGLELTAKAGGAFIKLDPSGVTLMGAAVNINSGGSPGVGSGIQILGPLIPWAADSDKAGKLLMPVSANTFIRDSRQGSPLIPMCGKLANGACSRVDCPCLNG